eukprot:6121706-Prymnesium_polylepis.2
MLPQVGLQPTARERSAEAGPPRAPDQDALAAEDHAHVLVEALLGKLEVAEHDVAHQKAHQQALVTRKQRQKVLQQVVQRVTPRGGEFLRTEAH